MRERPTPTPRASRPAAISVDIVLCSPHGRSLAVLLVRATRGARGSRSAWSLPTAPAVAGQPLETLAAQTIAGAAGAAAAWLAQCGTIAETRRTPSGVTASVGFVGVAPARATAPPAGGQWFAVQDLPALAPQHKALVGAAVATLRDRMDVAPVAFHLLPRNFTLSDLQDVYELLLGRRLHKASFRRALQAAYLVEPTDEWHSEGRGRPAQLFRFAPRRRRSARRAVRFDQLGG